MQLVSVAVRWDGRHGREDAGEWAVTALSDAVVVAADHQVAPSRRARLSSAVTAAPGTWVATSAAAASSPVWCRTVVVAVAGGVAAAGGLEPGGGQRGGGRAAAPVTPEPFSTLTVTSPGWTEGPCGRGGGRRARRRASGGQRGEERRDVLLARRLQHVGAVDPGLGVARERSGR